MKKNLLSKNLHQWLLLLVCFVGTLPSWAYTYVQDGVIYDIDASTNTAKVLGVEDLYTYSVTINEYIIGRRVTSIEDNAFQDCRNLTSVDIPNSVESIGSRAFYCCSSLTSITIPNSVTCIGEYAFCSCIYNHRTTKTNQKYPSVNL